MYGIGIDVIIPCKHLRHILDITRMVITKRTGNILDSSCHWGRDICNSPTTLLSNHASMRILYQLVQSINRRESKCWFGITPSLKIGSSDSLEYLLGRVVL